MHGIYDLMLHRYVCICQQAALEAKPISAG